MTDINKALTPVESIDKVPIDSATEYYADQKITFIFSANDMYMWLINDSYLSFDLNITRSAYSITCAEAKVANTPISSSYIRNACNIFRFIRVKYGGSVIEYNPYHQIETFLRQLDFGESYLLSNFNTFTTSQTIKENLAHLEISNGKYSANTAAATARNVASETMNIKNIIIPANILLPIFSDITAKGFPLGTLNNTLEIELFVATPESYLIDYSPKINDFSDSLWACSAATVSLKNYDTSAEKATAFGSIATRYPTNSIKLQNLNFHCKYYIPNENERAIIVDKANNSGFKYRYFDFEINPKSFGNIQSRNIIPFTIHTDNTKAIISYCYKKNMSPMLMYRPYINNVYLHMNGNDIPKQPISGNTYEYPSEYKFLIDDVFNNLDTYYSDTNNDLNKCYQFEESTKYNSTQEKPSSTFLILGCNFTTDPEDLGASSTRWQDTYQLHFSSEDTKKNSTGNTDATRDDLVFVLAIRKECGIIVKNGSMEQFDL